MALIKITTDIAGRVKKVKTKDFLVPLFEAVSNSIHAISAAAPRSGSIVIDLVREPRQLAIAGTGRDAPITGFVVTDNGVGFDDANMLSFCEADSQFKQDGKGVGRFSWLKFFERAVIESVYEDGRGRRMRRSFEFSRSGVEETPPTLVKAGPRTEVRLSPLHVVYEPRSDRSAEHVAVELIEHFIAYLVTESMPATALRDGAATIDIVDKYRTSIGKTTKRWPFHIGRHQFTATTIRFFLSNQPNTLFLCAHNRVAEKISLGRRDAFFARRFTDEDNLRTYAFQLFLQSDYLDEIVNDDRDGFQFPEPFATPAQADEVTREALLEEAFKIAREAMSSELEKLKAKNIAVVSSFVISDAPQYRRLLARHAEEVAAIHDTDKIKIDQTLRRLQFEEELKTRAEVAALLRKAEAVGESSRKEWQQKSAEVLAKLNEEGKASLAAYIVQRRLILDLLQTRMEAEGGAHAREEAIHQLIFPMRTTSDEVSYEEQNLWIIDERLSYHYHLASDKPLRTMPRAESTSAKEPDIIVFDRPIALNDRPESERAEAITIIEFKRPGDDAVDGAKTPVDQVLEYIELILEGRAKTRKDRPILPTDSTYFFGYVICELSPLLKKILKRRTMRETPDGRGMFGFFEDHRAYIEIISYEKMLDDAKRRNRILFDKLHMPAQ